MILIGENIHIISKKVQKALLENDKAFIKSLIELQKITDYADLNVGPAKGMFAGVLSRLAAEVQENSVLGISLDTTNMIEMENALSVIKNPQNTFLNSTSKDEPRLSKVISLATEYECNMVALTMSKETGIPKTADDRLDIAFEIYEKCTEKGVDSRKIYFDPLTLPVVADQSQAVQALNTLKMVKESFDPPVKTIIGLSNISNGAPAELRPLINKAFGVLAFGAGLDAAIIDAKDTELVRIFRMLSTSKPENELDKFYIRLAQTIADFGEVEDVEYDKTNPEQVKFIKAVNIVLSKKIYSDSFTQI